MTKLYEVRVNGLLMRCAVTLKGALALITEYYHNRDGVTVQRRGIVLWQSK